jgi:benzylsuccinate CoA-transferase BbsF subunit
MSGLPFEGVNILDFTWMGVGPFSVNHLLYYGATAIKVESKSRPDAVRYATPYKDGVAGLDRNYYFPFTHPVSSFDITLNLSHPGGVALAKKLVSWADIVAESFTAGTMEKWGLGYEDLVKIKPDIIMMRTCMHGQTGPLAKQPGHGAILTALSGLSAATGWADRRPSGMYGAFTDFVAPLFTSVALIAALDNKRRTGKGQCLDLSQHEQSMHFISPLILDYVVNGREPVTAGNHRPDAAPSGIYRCQGDDRWCAISVSTQDEWRNFCTVLGNPLWTRETKFQEFSARKLNEDELDHLVEEWTSRRTAEEVMILMQAAGVSAGLASNIEDMTKDPQLKHYGCFEELDHPEMGKMSFYHPPGFALSETPSRLGRPPLLGEHNDYVYTQILGIPEAEYHALIADGVTN